MFPKSKRLKQGDKRRQVVKEKIKLARIREEHKKTKKVTEAKIEQILWSLLLEIVSFYFFPLVGFQVFNIQTFVRSAWIEGT